jgi:hypothetical protein
MTSRRKIRAQLQRDRTLAFHDARRLAIELVHRRPSLPFAPMRAGVVLQPDEIAYRYVPATFHQLNGHGAHQWTGPIPVAALLTDGRALMRWPDGSLISLWWATTCGLETNLNTETLILDYGTGQPICLSGPTTPVLAVVAIAAIYGAEALLNHPALAPLRAGQPGTDQNLCRSFSRSTAAADEQASWSVIPGELRSAEFE